MSRNGIYWLTSYIKSGNTWVRCLIASVLSGGVLPDLNGLAKIVPSAASCRLLEKQLDLPLSDLTAAEISQLRGDAYRQRASGILKVHDAYSPELFPPDVTAGTVLIVRDPRDVAPSMAHHLGISVEDSVTSMGDPDFAIPANLTLAEQRLGSWSAHTQAWLEIARPLLVLRYEDLLADPIGASSQLCDFLSLEASAETIARAVESCRFESLQAAEAERGFTEKSQFQDRFFRSGRAGAWHESLSPEQAGRMVRHHGEMMCRVGYEIF